MRRENADGSVALFETMPPVGLSADAVMAAKLLSVAPAHLKGAVLYCDSRGIADRWIEYFQSLQRDGAPFRRVPGNISDERLLGGLDVATSLAHGRAVCDRGLLAESDGGCIVLSGCTTRASTYAHACRAFDHGCVSVEREGMSATHPATFAAIVVQCPDDDVIPSALVDRVAFHIPLNGVMRSAPSSARSVADSDDSLDTARKRFASVTAGNEALCALANAADRMSITSTRAVLLALSVARAHAALDMRTQVETEDILCATRLVLAPRAVQFTDGEQSASADNADLNSASDAPSQSENIQGEPQHGNAEQDAAASDSTATVETLTEVLVRAAAAAMPAGMLAAMAARSMSSRGSKGRSGDDVLRGVRGRQVGVRRGEPRGGARLDLVATLRAAVPWQRIRRASPATGNTRHPAPAVQLRRDDFRIRQCVSPAITTALFVVDTSGSAAMQRLAEAKGAIETMLAEGYARRDRVALITFRGTEASLVLPATHALARARRAISGLPAGGGTPLATALDLASTVVHGISRSGGQQVVVVLTDGRANVARDGKGGRTRAFDDAMSAAQHLGTVCRDVLWVDTSVTSEAASRQLAARAGARYLLLPSRGTPALAHALRSDSHRETSL